VLSAREAVLPPAAAAAAPGLVQDDDVDDGSEPGNTNLPGDAAGGGLAGHRLHRAKLLLGCRGSKRCEHVKWGAGEE
jgi:hypothetical protein